MFRLNDGICRNPNCKKLLHGPIVMKEKWIQKHVNIYIKHIVVASDEWNVNLFVPGMKFLHSFPDISKFIDFGMIYESYVKGYVEVIFGFHVDNKEDVKRDGSIY